MSVGNVILDEILKKGFLRNVEKTSKYFIKLNEIRKDYPKLIKEVRGVGLLIGLQLLMIQQNLLKNFKTTNCLQ